MYDVTRHRANIYTGNTCNDNNLVKFTDLRTANKLITTDLDLNSEHT